MKRCMSLFARALCCLVAGMGFADHTPEETNQVVRTLVGFLRNFSSIDDWAKDGALRHTLCPNSWEKFLDVADRSWTLEERKGAFDWYLTSLGTVDLRGRAPEEQDFVRCAIAQCSRLSYTNAVPKLFALALNTNGVHREDAVRIALRIGPVSDEATSFVEYVTTNQANLAGLRRGLALGVYGKKLFSTQTTNTPALTRAVEMFYRNRKSEIVVAHGCDMVLTNFISAYSISSNRLDAALWALTDLEYTTGRYRRYFDSVTNQLLSSGQPLQQLSLGGGD